MKKFHGWEEDGELESLSVVDLIHNSPTSALFCSFFTCKSIS